ncbi:hypothetical protein K470DRAFT_260701 [Piedraia hortae CBS 480.64]|uniref:Exocyst complex protein EXO70 n=1 Tax=Piedraia hortae CBS 480.64 TaxID=1314780 RepID=A0A6A7BR12_9PEZI|nr:hypothetical protein K470DRAFT_260701 [Piedraia hortae CBS 480.64]
MVAPKAYAEEAAEVEVLSANLDKLKSLTKRIGSSLHRLEASGQVMHEAMDPVYGNTQRLQTMNKNVDNIMAAIDRVQQPLDIRNREDQIIRAGPEQVGLQEYMASIDRTSQALSRLQATNMRSNQTAISELSELLSTGTGKLDVVFRDLVRQESHPLEPLRQIMSGSEFPRINPNKASQLRAIDQHTHRSAQVQPGELSSCARTYARERGHFIQLSLQNLAAAAIQTARKMNADAVYAPGSNGITSYVAGLKGMYAAEYDSVCAIFQRDEWLPILQAACQPSLSAFAMTLKELDVHIRSHLLTDCFLAYEINDVASNAALQLEATCGEAIKHAMLDAVKPVRETAKASLSSLLHDIRTKVRGMVTLPPDGAAVPLTTEVVQRLQLMTTYLSPLTSIMRSLGDGGWSSPAAGMSAQSVPTLKSFDVGADGRQLFSHYASDSVEMLLSGLEERARQGLKGKSLQGVFLANNIIVIERLIRSSDLNSLMQTALTKLEAARKRATGFYMEMWKEPSTHLLDIQYTSKGGAAARPPSTGQGVDSAAVLKSLSSKDRDGIKEKFRNFNTAFDECVTRHKSYRMEPEVRRQLGRDVQHFIEPLYNRFWERYHDVDKGKGKYVKYDKTQMANALASLA